MKFNIVIIVLTCITIFTVYRWTEISRERELQFRHSLLDQDKSYTRTEIEERELKDKKFLKKVLAAGTVVIIWQGIWSPTNQYNIEQSATRNQYESYLSGFENGWDDQCSAIFSRLGGSGNQAIGRGIAITYPQCVSLKLSTSGSDSFDEHIGGYAEDSSDYEMRESGRNYANREVLLKIFSMSPYWCYGVECVSERDFGIFRPN